jgi:ferritin
MKLTPEVEAALQAQVSLELRNALAYLAAYSSLRSLGWEGFSKLAKNDAFGEFGHAQNFVKYMARREAAAATIPLEGGEKVDMAPVEFAELAAKLEAETEEAMALVVQTADEAGDVGTVEYVSGKLIDQQKESQDARDFAARVRSCSEDALVLMDRELED